MTLEGRLKTIGGIVGASALAVAAAKVTNIGNKVAEFYSHRSFVHPLLDVAGGLIALSSGYRNNLSGVVAGTGLMILPELVQGALETLDIIPSNTYLGRDIYANLAIGAGAAVVGYAGDVATSLLSGTGRLGNFVKGIFADRRQRTTP